MNLRSGRKKVSTRFLFAIALVCLAASALVSLPRHVFATHDPICHEETLSVTLVPNSLTRYSIVGWLCSNGTLAGKTVQVLVSGGAYSHVYWDFPYQPDHYSYVRSSVQAGYAVFNFDRIGIGQSAHPLSALVTVLSNASVVHQIVQALRRGQFEGVSFQKVIVVGHSLGSAISLYEAGQYPGDVNGVIITGFLHTVNALEVPILAKDIHPAQLDPRFVDQGYLPGYLTTRPGTRGQLFYSLPTTEAQVLATDEATKATFTDAEASTFFPLVPAPLSRQIHVPVLLAEGKFDHFFCEGTVLVNCSDPRTVQDYEAAFFSQDAHLQVQIIDQAGHDLNLQENAPFWFEQAISWADDAVGSK